MRRDIGAVVAIPRNGWGLRVPSAIRWRGAVPQWPQDADLEVDPWGVDEPGVSPRVAGLACGAAILAVALAGWLAG